MVEITREKSSEVSRQGSAAREGWGRDKRHERRVRPTKQITDGRVRVCANGSANKIEMEK
jgi:hypothetical protein